MSICFSGLRRVYFGLLTPQASPHADVTRSPLFESVGVEKLAVGLDLCARHYQKRVARLVISQLLVLCICNSMQLILRAPWTSHERPLGLLEASRAFSLAGLMIQLTFHMGSPYHIKEALEQLGPRLTDTRATMFLVTLWFPYLPFVLSVLLLCHGE